MSKESEDIRKTHERCHELANKAIDDHLREEEDKKKFEKWIERGRGQIVKWHGNTPCIDNMEYVVEYIAFLAGLQIGREEKRTILEKIYIPFFEGLAKQENPNYKTCEEIGYSLIDSGKREERAEWEKKVQILRNDIKTFQNIYDPEEGYGISLHSLEDVIDRIFKTPAHPVEPAKPKQGRGKGK
jgi:hypothetical protein